MNAASSFLTIICVRFYLRFTLDTAISQTMGNANILSVMADVSISPFAIWCGAPSI